MDSKNGGNDRKNCASAGIWDVKEEGPKKLSRWVAQLSKVQKRNPARKRQKPSLVFKRRYLP